MTLVREEMYYDLIFPLAKQYVTIHDELIRIFYYLSKVT